MLAQSITTKCHNCRGTGMVDGGCVERIKKQIDQLKLDCENKINNIKDKDKIKRKQLEKQINNSYYDLISQKDNEKRTIKGKCLYCIGTGFRNV